MRLKGVRQRLLASELVNVTSPLARPLYDAGGNKILDETLDIPFGHADFGGDVTDPNSGIGSQGQQHQTVVGKPVPVFFCHVDLENVFQYAGEDRRAMKIMQYKSCNEL